MSVEVTKPTHPFFHVCGIPQRSVEVDRTAQTTKISPSHLESTNLPTRKRKRSTSTSPPQNFLASYHAPDDSVETIRSEQGINPGEERHDQKESKVLTLSADGKLSNPSMAAKTVAPATEQRTTSSISLSKRNVGRGRPRKAKKVLPSAQASLFLVRIKYGQANRQRRLDMAKQIDKLLVSSPVTKTSPPSAESTQYSQKPTHPFFSDLNDHSRQSHEADPQHDRNYSARPDMASQNAPRPTQAPVPWKKLGSSSQPKAARCSEILPVLWPPVHTQRVDDLNSSGRPIPPDMTRWPLRTYKCKGRIEELQPGQDVLNRIGRMSRVEATSSNHCLSHQPSRRVVAGWVMSAELEGRLSASKLHPAVRRAKCSLANLLPAFDRGQYEQASWLAQSAPSVATEVLQPGPEAVMLRDWIQKLTVTSSESVQPTDKVKRTKRRGRRKKSRSKLAAAHEEADVLDDFIVSSEDEADELVEIEETSPDNLPFEHDSKRTVLRAGALNSKYDRNQVRNAILISGPNGCGKTASVYAVAQELGFEVFEISPGSRRTARDLLDKVGEMTQNHLVQQKQQQQQSQEGDRAEIAESVIDDYMVQKEIASGKQYTMQGFFNAPSKQPTKQPTKKPKYEADGQSATSKVSTEKPRRTPKQSLILLEEVDILFDEDRSFWAGAMSLIEQSKRPVVMTCNDEAKVPLDELCLHGIFRYSAIDEDMATDFLLAVAASQGHALSRQPVTSLYRAKHRDLRATISELNFWCQIGVGSQQAGLDWMLLRNHRSTTVDPGQQPKIFSVDTYVQGLELGADESTVDIERLLLDGHVQYDVPLDSWLPETETDCVGCETADMTVRNYSFLTDSHSDLDIFQRALPSRGQIEQESTSGTDEFETRICPDGHYDGLSDLHLKICTSLTAHIMPATSPHDVVRAFQERRSKQNPSRSSTLDVHALSEILAPLQQPSRHHPRQRRARQPAITTNSNSGNSTQRGSTDVISAFSLLSSSPPSSLSACSSSARPSPSLDSPRPSTLLADLAPYVRSIVSFEQRWAAAVAASTTTTSALTSTSAPVTAGGEASSCKNPNTNSANNPNSIDLPLTAPRWFNNNNNHDQRRVTRSKATAAANSDSVWTGKGKDDSGGSFIDGHLYFPATLNRKAVMMTAGEEWGGKGR